MGKDERRQTIFITKDVGKESLGSKKTYKEMQIMTRKNRKKKQDGQCRIKKNANNITNEI